jgi:hypothetical protein
MLGAVSVVFPVGNCANTPALGLTLDATAAETDGSRSPMHPFLEFTEHGYEVDIASPAGGALQGDAFSDPRDESGYSAEDLISLGFINSPPHMKLVEESKPLGDVRVTTTARRRPGPDVHVRRR